MRREILRTPEQVLDPNHTALFIIDMQYDCCSTEGAFAKGSNKDFYGIQLIIPKMKSLLDSARKSGVIVVHLRQTTLPNRNSDSDAWLAFKTRDGKSGEYTIPGTKGYAIMPDFAPLPQEILISKFRPSGFHGTFLNQLLQANGIRSVVITGVNTEGCVLATVMDAAFHDYYSCVAQDAISTVNAGMHEHAIILMKSRYRMFDTQEILAVWNKADNSTK